VSLPQHFAQVSPTVWRSAQPLPANWLELYNLGIRQWVKLDTEAEGTSDGAAQAGVTVIACPIEPIDDGSVVQKLEAIFMRPSEAVIDRALAAMASGTLTLVSCLHGNDRTGICCAIYRVLVQGWSKGQAWNEMLDDGYHPELLGLDEEWFFGHPRLT